MPEDLVSAAFLGRDPQRYCGFIWIALAFLVRNPPVVWRGVLAMAGSGLGFYAISGIWRPFDPQGWDYAVHFISWTVAYLPGFLALLVARSSTLGGATGKDPAQERLASGD